MSNRSELKQEQLERIKQRDSFLNLNIVAVGVLVAVAVQDGERTYVWFAVPWVTTILGWAHLQNDDKVSAIARHILEMPKDPAVTTWEETDKGYISPHMRRWADSVVYFLCFLLPTPVALVSFHLGAGEHRWSLSATLLAVAETGLSLGLLFLLCISVRHRRRL